MEVINDCVISVIGHIYRDSVQPRVEDVGSAEAWIILLYVALGTAV